MTENQTKAIEYMRASYDETRNRGLIRAKDIAAALGITPQALAGSMRGLTSKGIVKRIPQAGVSLYILTEVSRS